MNNIFPSTPETVINRASSNLMKHKKRVAYRPPFTVKCKICNKEYYKEYGRMVCSEVCYLERRRAWGRKTYRTRMDKVGIAWVTEKRYLNEEFRHKNNKYQNDWYHKNK